jgi:hypothetical protein
MTRKEELSRRAGEFTKRYGLALGEELGFGIHGIVFALESQTEPEGPTFHSALKVHEQEQGYRRERDGYLRLQSRQVRKIRGCEVPELLRHDDELWAIEMTIVTRPFVLDFAGAYLDRAPDFSEEVLADWLADKREQYGRRWPEVQAILAILETYGVFMEDVSPGNISLGD